MRNGGQEEGVTGGGKKAVAYQWPADRPRHEDVHHYWIDDHIVSRAHVPRCPVTATASTCSPNTIGCHSWLCFKYFHISITYNKRGQ
jgi:hypothetical protein